MKNLKAIILDAVDSGLNAFAHLEGGPVTAKALLDQASGFSTEQFDLACRLMEGFELNKAAGMFAIFGLAYGCETGIEAVIEEIRDGLTDNEIAAVFKWWVIYVMSSILTKLVGDSEPTDKDLLSAGYGRN